MEMVVFSESQKLIAHMTDITLTKKRWILFQRHLEKSTTTRKRIKKFALWITVHIDWWFVRILKIVSWNLDNVPSIYTYIYICVCQYICSVDMYGKIETERLGKTMGAGSIRSYRTKSRSEKCIYLRDAVVFIYSCNASDGKIKKYFVSKSTSINEIKTPTLYIIVRNCNEYKLYELLYILLK